MASKSSQKESLENELKKTGVAKEEEHRNNVLQMPPQASTILAPSMQAAKQEGKKSLPASGNQLGKPKFPSNLRQRRNWLASRQLMRLIAKAMLLWIFLSEMLCFARRNTV
jgi:hypothetical protein